MDEAADEFWRFSLAFYGKPGIAEALIGLQDRQGLDVNLILWALWLGVTGRRRLDAGELAAAETAVRDLRQAVVEPLRHLRRALRPHRDDDIQQLRGRIKGLEIEAERLAQRRLATGALEPSVAPAARLAAAEANLALCLGPALTGSAEAATIRRQLQAFARPQD